MIGGYAVATYGRPGYPDDVDIVVPDATHRELEAFIAGQGLMLEKRSIPNPQNYEGKVRRYGMEELTLDILVSCVRDREARVDIPESWISRNLIKQRLITLTGGTVNKISIIRPEALWAFKLQSGLDQDITDLFSISNVKINSNEIANLFRDLKSESLVEKLSKTLTKAQTGKLYGDSMSRMEFKRMDSRKKERTYFVNRLQYIISETIRQ